MRLFKRFSNGVINFASVDVVKRKKNEKHWIWMRMSDRFEKVNCKKKCMQEGAENIGGVEGATEKGD